MEQKIFSKGKIAEKTSKIWFALTRFFTILLVFLSVALNINKAIDKYDKNSVIFKNDADFQKKIEGAENYEEQQSLMNQRVSQLAYEKKYGKPLKENVENEFEQNPSNKWGSIFGSIFGGLILGILGFYILKFLFKPLINNFVKYQQFKNAEIKNLEYKKNKKLTILNTIIITTLLIIPTFGIILTLTFFQLNFTLKT